MVLKHIWSLALDSRVAVSARHLNSHRLAIECEAIHEESLLDIGVVSVEDDEGLTLALHAGLGDNVDDRTDVGEDASQDLLHLVNLASLVKVVDVDAARQLAGSFI